MTPAEVTDSDIAKYASALREQGAPFAIATVIRTAGSTAARPGAKALLDASGTILQGWIGGGCVRGALKKATMRALDEAQPQLISLHPQDVLDERGVAAGDELDGVRFARNGCPSKGSIDIFVEIVLPLPELVIFGSSPVALALADLATRFQWAVLEATVDQLMAPRPNSGQRMVVVATQGKEDLSCLRTALELKADFTAFVGSRRKFAALSDKLKEAGADAARLAAVQAPAGLPINAVTPEEIALSILAQLTEKRRQTRSSEGGGNV